MMSMDIEEVAVNAPVTSRKRKSLDAELKESTSSTKKAKSTKTSTAKKTSTTKKTASSRKSAISMDVDQMDANAQEEFALFSTMDIDGEGNGVLLEGDAAAKRLSFTSAETFMPTETMVDAIQVVNMQGTDDNSAVNTTAGFTSPIMMPTMPIMSTEEAPRSRPSHSYRESPSRIAVSSMMATAPSPSIRMSTRSRRSSATNSIPTTTPMAPATYTMEMKTNQPEVESIQLVERAEVVPVAMDSRNPMWYTWMSRFLVLFFVGSSFFSSSKTAGPATNQIPVAEPTSVSNENEPNLWMKNYSVPRFAPKSMSEVVEMQTAMEPDSAEEEEEEMDIDTIISMEYVFMDNKSQNESHNNLFSFTVEDLNHLLASQVTAVEVETEIVVESDEVETPVVVIPDADIVSSVVEEEEEEVAVAAVESSMEHTVSALVEEDEEIVEEESAMGVAESSEPEVQEAAEEVVMVEEVAPVSIENEAEVMPDVSQMPVSFKTETLMQDILVSIPVIFPPQMNIAEDDTGARMLAKESTKKCVKAQKWNPFSCHRPLRTVNSYLPITSSSDCFAFYLETEESKLSKNVLSVKLFQPAKTIYGFGVTHFLADETAPASQFNVSCAPKDISFTVYENIPSVMGESKVKESTTNKKKFRFPWSKKDTVEENDNMISETKTTTFMPSLHIPTTFDGLVFNPLGDHVAKSDRFMIPSSSPVFENEEAGDMKMVEGVSVTQFFPLQTTHFPQFVDKVSMHVHSTHSGDNMACVYRVQVYGDFDLADN